MGKHAETKLTPGKAVPAVLRTRVTKKSPSSRSRFRLIPGHRSTGMFIAAFLATVSFMLVNVVDPYSGTVASPYFIPVTQSVNVDSDIETQNVAIDGKYTTAASRDGVKVSAPKPASASAPAAGTPDPGSAQAIALQKVTERGWGMDQYSCLVSLWNRESRWNVYAHNKSSGAYGIPQSLPGEKMATVADDWQTNPATQIEWGLRYISARYGSPCGAWAHSEARNWY